MERDLAVVVAGAYACALALFTLLAAERLDSRSGSAGADALPELIRGSICGC